MKTLLKFNDWLLENAAQPRPLKKVGDLGINRKFGRNPHTGDKYETELFPMFRRLKPRIEALPKKPTLEEFFAMLQNSDNQFYSMVQADTLAQPDVRELWRDLTGRRASKMKKYNLTESSDETSGEPSAVWRSEIDPSWTILVLWPEDELYGNVAKIFDQLGTAFADLSSKTVFIDGVQVESQNLTQDHLLAIEAHEISHSLLNHHGSNRLAKYDERQEREADWLAIRILDQLGFGKASTLLEERYQNYYDESSSELENTDELERSLEEYVK
jgi:hypothetical protein